MRIALLICLLLPRLSKPLTQFRATNVSTSFCNMRRGIDIFRPVDCAMKCIEKKIDCVGIVRVHKFCYIVYNSLPTDGMDESNVEKGSTRIHVLNNSLTVCPKSEWNFTAANNVTSVYYFRTHPAECFQSGNRPAVITSEAELRYLAGVQYKVGGVFLTGARANGTRWKWQGGREPVNPAVWKNSALPTPSRGRVGVIFDNGGIVGVDPIGGEKVVCECYEVTEY